MTLHPPTRIACLLAAALVGCSGPQVRSLGTGGGPPAFELRGDSAAALQAEAQRLCPTGYSVLRQAQQFAPVQGDDNAGTAWLQQAGFWLEGMPGNKAQATVQCKG